MTGENCTRVTKSSALKLQGLAATADYMCDLGQVACVCFHTHKLKLFKACGVTGMSWRMEVGVGRGVGSQGKGQEGTMGRGGEVLPFPFLPTEGGSRNLQLGGLVWLLGEGVTLKGMASQSPLPPQLQDCDCLGGQTGNLPRPGRHRAAAPLGPGPDSWPCPSRRTRGGRGYQKSSQPATAPG
uniref:Uncharacterized protein n=1 Tax=Rousettus aegyptiacus TaxID=9407 RepID=A0A7J8C2G6_ROUAE|nr:hypothetical protein HJG63_009370 [Rousettus aegyptiacus]